MCTVSFVSVKNSVFITSNRDEHIQRKNAAAPHFENRNDKKIIFPKDGKAGGTWFAAVGNGNVAVLLNGAFVKHTANPPYRKSRGLILLDIIESDDPYLFFKALDLQQIEPFTVVLYQTGLLYELRWDGIKKYDKQLPASSNYIWSSATLYSDDIIEERKNKFNQFISNHEKMTVEMIHNFHNSNQGDEENGFIINRDTGMKTFSITQAVISPQQIEFLHDDLLQDKQYSEILPLTSKFTREEI